MTKQAMTMVFAVMCLLGSGCSRAVGDNTRGGPPRVGMPNPASQFCIDQGGRLEIREQENGQAGYCHLSDGRVIEEWEYFRASCPPPAPMAQI